MTTNDVSDTRISTERLAFLKLWAEQSDDEITLKASEVRELLASRHPQPVNEPAEMTPEEVRLEDLKQRAAYGGPIVSFDVREPYYLASCDKCGWVGSTELCGTDSFGDDSDVYCPRCHAPGADCGKVAEALGRAASIPAPERSKEEKGALSYFTANVDTWGAAQWFDRLAKAIRDHDAAVVSGDEIEAETCRMIASSSAMRLVRDFEPAVRSALETPSLHKEGEAVYFAEGNTVRKRVGSAFGEGDVLFCTPSAWFPANEVADLLNAVPVPVTITEEWQSRNTMPKDGSPFLVSYARHVFRARWWGGTTLSIDGRSSGIAFVDVSGWMPLPAALSVKPGEQG